jgi:hypothetical protein
MERPPPEIKVFAFQIDYSDPRLFSLRDPRKIIKKPAIKEKIYRPAFGNLLS